jgi:hypothetical protein
VTSQITDELQENMSKSIQQYTPETTFNFSALVERTSNLTYLEIKIRQVVEGHSGRDV